MVVTNSGQQFFRCHENILVQNKRLIWSEGKRPFPVFSIYTSRFLFRMSNDLFIGTVGFHVRDLAFLICIILSLFVLLFYSYSYFNFITPVLFERANIAVCQLTMSKTSCVGFFDVLLFLPRGSECSSLKSSFINKESPLCLLKVNFTVCDDCIAKRQTYEIRSQKIES